MIKLLLIKAAHQIKPIIPPIIWLFIRKYLMPDYPKVFEGVYSTLGDVKESGYNSLDSLEKIYDQTLQRLSTYNNSKLPESNLQSPIANLLPLVVALALEDKERISILDYGGGMGISYLNCLSALQGSNITNIDYHIVDLEDTIEYGMKIYPEDMAIHFHRDVPEALKDVDIVYIGSTLQYIDDYKVLIQRLAKLTPRYILLTDYFTSEAETFATAQVNMSGRRMAYWIFNLSEIVELVAQQGYKKIYETKNHQPLHNLPDEFRIDDTRNLLFSRKV